MTELNMSFSHVQEYVPWMCLEQIGRLRILPEMGVFFNIDGFDQFTSEVIAHGINTPGKNIKVFVTGIAGSGKESAAAGMGLAIEENEELRTHLQRYNSYPKVHYLALADCVQLLDKLSPQTAENRYSLKRVGAATALMSAALSLEQAQVNPNDYPTSFYIIEAPAINHPNPKNPFFERELNLVKRNSGGTTLEQSEEHTSELQ